MKKKDLELEISRIESERKNPEHTYSVETVANEQVKLNKLYIRLISDFNEVTNKYNKWLVRLTWAIAILTLVMVIRMFTGRG
ncbi:MAG: hypothetical protein A3K16_03280 [Omnitrophica bacterium RIFCSPLOWO2_01_FULL_45_24]|nr:MAG: hypothetical protein A3K16_03280 [Omnitrophica bacterium RIFCSPLOWO2_01_FULL_45_24]